MYRFFTSVRTFSATFESMLDCWVTSYVNSVISWLSFPSYYSSVLCCYRMRLASKSYNFLLS